MGSHLAAEPIGFRGCTDTNPDLCACGTDEDVTCAACDEAIVDGEQVYSAQVPAYLWLALEDRDQEWLTLMWHARCDERAHPHLTLGLPEEDCGREG